MMPTAPPISTDSSQIHLNIPTPYQYPLPPPPVPVPNHSKSRVLNILKLLIGLFIALILAAIFVVLIFFPRKSDTCNGIDLHESNEKIAELQRQSNENIAKLQREQQLSIEKEHQQRQDILMKQQYEIEKKRLEYQENLTERYRLEDRSIERQRREQELYLIAEQAKKQLELEQKRLDLLLEERLLNEKRRKEDLDKENENLLNDFMDEVIDSRYGEGGFDRIKIKVPLIIRRLDSLQKSLLISNLYKLGMLSRNSEPGLLDLYGVNLQNINLTSTGIESTLPGSRLNYNQLALPSTILTNALFEQMDIMEANFSLTNMILASFQGSNAVRSNFNQAILSFGNFGSANLIQSRFSQAKVDRATFQNARLMFAEMDNANFEYTNFQQAIALDTNFSRSNLAGANFQNTDLTHARLVDVSARSANFNFAKGIRTNFSYADVSSCMFQWADLSNASFRRAFLAGSNFQNAIVKDADFSYAILPGANLTDAQLDSVLSISQAVLPDGSRGKNKNLLKNGNANCEGINSSIFEWKTIENVIVIEDQLSTECSFQAKSINAKLEQIIDIQRYKPLIENEQGKIYFELQDKTTNILNPSVYIIVHFLDLNNNQIGDEKSSLNMTSSTLSPKFTGTFLCPSNTAQIQLTVIFQEVNAIVDDIYVTIE